MISSDFLFLRKLDIYVLKSFLLVFLLSIFSLIGLYIVIHFFTNISDFIEISQQNVFVFILWYYLIRIPLILSKLLPIMALIAVMMTVTRLMKTRELVAMLSSGISVHRAVLPVLIFLLVIVAMMYYVDNSIIPGLGNDISLTEKIIKSEGSDRFLTRQVPNYQFTVKIYNYTKQQMNDVWINQYDQGGNLIAQITAQSAFWGARKDLVAPGPGNPRRDSSGQPGDKGWVLSNGTVHYYDAKGFRSSLPQPFNEKGYFVSCALTPQSIEKIGETSSYMTLAQLKGSISAQPDNVGLRMQYYSKITAPLIILILIFIGLPFSITKKSQNFFSGIGVCLIISLGFFVCKFLSENLGNKGIIPPFWGVTAPLILFAAVAMALTGRIKS